MTGNSNLLIYMFFFDSGHTILTIILLINSNENCQTYFTHTIFIKVTIEWLGNKSEDSNQPAEGKEHPKISLHFL